MPSEDLALVVGGIDVAAHPGDGETLLCHQGDIDAPFVVAVDQHDVLIPLVGCGFEHVLVEADQRGPVVGFDNPDDVGVDVCDDPGGVADGFLVNGFPFQLEPSDPVAPAVGDDLHAGGGAFEEPAPVLAETDQAVAGVAVLQAEFGEDLDDAVLVGIGVGVFLQQVADPVVGIEDGSAVGPAAEPEDFGSAEEVHHVV